MNLLTKKLLYGALLAGSTALLVPELLGTSTPRPEPPAERGAEEALEPAATSSGVAAPLPATGSSGAVPVPEEPPAEGAPAATALSQQDSIVPSMEASLQMLETFFPAQTGGELLDVPRPVDPVRSGLAAELARPGLEVLLDDYLLEHPLQGLIAGPERGAALLGGEILREGQELVDGRLRLEQVAPRSITFTWEGGSRRVSLPPLVPRPRTSHLGEAGGASSQEGTGGVVPSAAPVQETGHEQQP